MRAIDDLRWRLARDGFAVDPANYYAEKSDGPMGVTTINPDASRGPYVMTGLFRNRSATSTTAVRSKMLITVDGRRVTDSPVGVELLCNYEDGLGSPAELGWPAPIFTFPGQQVNLSEETTDAFNDVNINYTSSGFHVSDEAFTLLARTVPQFAAFGMDVTCTLADTPYRIPYNVPEPLGVDYIVTLRENASANRADKIASLNVSINNRNLLNMRFETADSGVIRALETYARPNAAVGRFLIAGDQVVITETAVDATRRDIWGFFGQRTYAGFGPGFKL